MDPLTIKWLIENTQNQYNLVCNVLMEVCGCNDNEKLNDIAILCCEFTAQCPSLSSEWMGAFAALCNAPVDYGYQVCTFFFVEKPLLSQNVTENFFIAKFYRSSKEGIWQKNQFLNSNIPFW